MRRGKRSHWLAGAATGAVAGLAFAGLYCSGGDCNSEELAGIGAAFGGIGAASGALVGLAIRTSRWEKVPPERMRVVVAPLRGRGLAVSVVGTW